MRDLLAGSPREAHMLLRRIKSLIGLDVGTRAVKAVELTWNAGPVITGFGYAELPGPEAG